MQRILHTAQDSIWRHLNPREQDEFRQIIFEPAVGAGYNTFPSMRLPSPALPNGDEALRLPRDGGAFHASQNPFPSAHTSLSKRHPRLTDARLLHLASVTAPRPSLPTFPNTDLEPRTKRSEKWIRPGVEENRSSTPPCIHLMNPYPAHGGSPSPSGFSRGLVWALCLGS